jgi:hypothetical protein
MDEEANGMLPATGVDFSIHQFPSMILDDGSGTSQHPVAQSRRLATVLRSHSNDCPVPAWHEQKRNVTYRKRALNGALRRQRK